MPQKRKLEAVIDHRKNAHEHNMRMAELKVNVKKTYASKARDIVLSILENMDALESLDKEMRKECLDASFIEGMMDHQKRVFNMVRSNTERFMD